MPRKGMRSLFFHSKATSFCISPHSSPSRSTVSSTPGRTISESRMEQIIQVAESMIMKWNPDSSTFTSLFHENKREAMLFLKCVNDLQKAMHLLVSENSASEKLVHAQNLMQIAMKRLQKEFYQILSINQAHLDPESVSSTQSSRASFRSSTSDYEDDVSLDDEIRAAGGSISEVEEVSSIAMADLKSIADCMISSGYAKECMSIYKIIRKSIIDEGIYRLGVEQLVSSKISKMDWEVIELKIKNWLEAVKISMRTLFTGERILCDHVFASSYSIRESCFAEISKEGATLLFEFPELVTKNKKSPEKMFRLLDMYTAISENWPEIESIFSFDSTSSVRTQALNSLFRLGDSVHAVLRDFETTIQKDSSKSQVSGGGIHPLTLYAMNYLSLLADYSNVLADIFVDLPPREKSSLPESYFDSPVSDDSSAPSISLRLAWLVLILLCKLDRKAEHYKDIALSYLFLANNLQHVVSKVRTSNLQFLLGDDWIAKHEARVRQFTGRYETIAWDPVISSLPENPTAVISPDEARECFRKFNSSFEEAYLKCSACIVPDPKLQEEIKGSLGRKLVAVYREFYDTHKVAVGRARNVSVFVRFAPEDLENYLSDLFLGTDSDSVSSSSSSSSSSSFSSHRRHSRSR